MPKLKIYTFPDAVLAKKASPIERVEKDLHKLADEMLETMYEAPGVGLAANQIGLLKRIIVVDSDYEIQEPETEGEPVGVEVAGGATIKNKKPIILINPIIEKREGEVLSSEGCLSVPEFNAEIKRAEKVWVRYQDIDGLTKEISAEGLQAIVLQHEIDHLEGKLFIDRLSTIKKEVVKRKLKQERREREQELEDVLEGRVDGGPRKKGSGF